MAQRSWKILVIDDSPLVCSLVKEAIQKYSNHECATLCDGQKALDAIHEYQPDLLVLDVGLPGMDGFEFIVHLREDKKWEAIPIILLANKNIENGIENAYECGADDLLVKPFDPVGLVLKIKSLYRRMSSTYRLATTTLEKKTIRALGRSVEVKDTYTEGHSARVAFYSLIISKALLLSEAEISTIEDAAYLHDIGKIGIKEEILNKRGPLTKDEWDLMKTHPEKSAIILGSLGFLSKAVPLVKAHHEKLDGSGYPLGLKGDEIPNGARIISIADSFDAITSNRSFREKRDLDLAIEELVKNKGTQFDAMLVDVFIAEIRSFPGIETLQSHSSEESFEFIKSLKG